MNCRIKTLLLSAVLLVTTSAKAQSEWTADNIPDSLKDKRTISVVRLHDVSYTQTGDYKGTYTIHRVVTILNERADDEARWVEAITSKNEDLSSFKGAIYNSTGKVTKKIKRGDLSFSDFSPYLAGDTRRFYYVPEKQISYPYTIEYEWTINVKDGLLSYAYFDPIESEYQSFQEGRYKVSLFPGTEFGHKEIATDTKMNVNEGPKYTDYIWDMPAQKAIVIGEMEKPALYRIPAIMAMPKYISYGGFNGCLDSWKTFGKWGFDVSDNRDNLPAEAADKIRKLTDGLSTNREKIAAIYKYLGDNTRYEAIMLGIGGWQPMTAEEVVKTGFSDCKGLSNYMKAMLKAVGIESHLVSISTKYKDLLPSFPNFRQLDHKILCVPNGGDTLWIDCTATAVFPFGHVPVDLRGHECIIDKPEGGILARIPDAKPEDNTFSTTMEITFDENMKVSKGHIKEECTGEYFEQYIKLPEADAKKKNDVMSGHIDLNNSKVSNIQIQNIIGEKPCTVLECDFVADYARKSGTRFFVPLNTSTSFNVPSFPAGRTAPIYNENIKCIQDKIVLHFPANAHIDAKPEWVGENIETSTIALITDYGTCVVKGNIDKNNTVTAEYKIIFKAIDCPADHAAAIKDFYTAMKKRLTEMLVVKIQ